MNAAPDIVAQPPDDELIALLVACGLPVDDIGPSSPAEFFAIRQDGAIVAVVGLERYPPVGLLRSLAVAPAWRGRGLATRLLAFAESFAGAHGVASLFLLTTTAGAYFAGKGYAPALRSAAPPAIQATSQFSALCPASSAFLGKTLAAAK